MLLVGRENQWRPYTEDEVKVGWLEGLPSYPETGRGELDPIRTMDGGQMLHAEENDYGYEDETAVQRIAVQNGNHHQDDLRPMRQYTTQRNVWNSRYNTLSLMRASFAV